MAAAEIIAVGTELLTPDKTDTNSLWLTSQLNERGIEVKLKTIVGDDPVRLEEAVRDAFGRSEVVIVTGGLGPTEDDITRSATAAAINRSLIFHEEILEELRRKFKAFGSIMPERNRRQAYIIEGAEIIENTNGSAPGMMYSADNRLLIVLPGPPRELKPMFERDVLPEIKKMSGQLVVLRKTLRVTGLGESRLDELISHIYTKYTNPSTSTLFSKTDIEVQFTATAATLQEANKLNEKVSSEVAEVLGDAVYAFDGEPIEKVLGDLLVRQGLHISVAESCTGGLVAKRLTDTPGASEYFLEGLVTYSNNAKIRNLGVPKETIDSHGAVSPEVAEAMAKGIRERSGSDISVSITGIAGPGGGSDDKPVGTVFIGYADETKVFSKRIMVPGNRDLIRWRSSQMALDIARRQILEKYREKSRSKEV